MKSLTTIFFLFFFMIITSRCSDSKMKKKYYPSGKLETTYCIDDKQKKDGIQKTFWENGNIKGISEWKHGVADGMSKEYYESGKISAIGHFTNGLEDSVETAYFENVKIHTKCHYENGKTDGVFLSYFSDGRIETVADYKNDTVVSHIDFNDDIMSSVSNYFVSVGRIDVSDTLYQSTRSNKLIFTLSDSSYSEYFTGSVNFYNKREDILKAPAFKSLTIQSFGEFVAKLPEDIKTGKYCLSLTVTPINEIIKSSQEVYYKDVFILK